MDMTHILWLVLAGGYGVFTWAAGENSKAALCFWNGGYLALLCFAVLPKAMGTAYFFLSALFAGLGILLAFRLEGKRLPPPLVFGAITGYHILGNVPVSPGETLLLSFFGGMGLYHASASIIPDKIEIGKALLSGAGFLCGTFLFCCF